MAAPASYSRRSFVGNAAATTVPLGLGSGDGSCTIASATNWPSGSGGDFLVVIDRGQNTEELAWSSGVSGTTLTFALRGAQGTSGVAHAAGCSIALSMGQQDLDEANQVVAGVLGQASAAKGDILAMLSAAGPNTLTRVGIGTNGVSTLGVASGLPAWETSPGRLLATQQYAPASDAAYSVSSTTLAVTDSTNATLSLTVPASGNVDIVVSAAVTLDIGSTGAGLVFALKNHSGGAQLGFTQLVLGNATASTNLEGLVVARFHLTGQSPGALQVDLAAAIGATSGVTATIHAQGATGNPTNFSPLPPLIMQAFAA